MQSAETAATLAALGLPQGSRILLDTSALIPLVEGGVEGWVESGVGKESECPRLGRTGLATARGRLPDESRARAMGRLFECAAAGDCSLFASALAWTEILRKAPGEALALEWRRILSDSRRIVIVPIDVAVAEEAAAILRQASARGGKSPGLADALHVASALVAGADALLSADKGWKDLAPPGLRLLDLGLFAAALGT